MITEERLKAIRERAERGEYYNRERFGECDADEDVLGLLAEIADLTRQLTDEEQQSAVLKANYRNVCSDLIARDQQIAALTQERDEQRQAANHWFEDANESHNRLTTLREGLEHTNEPVVCPWCETKFVVKLVKQDDLATMRQLVGWLSADIPELHEVEVPRLADSLNRFLTAHQRPQENVR